ncbi:MAG: hypothetical protein WBQ94_04440 [Terracidiphilus sp.]
MSLWNRPNGPVSPAANSATATALNTQAAISGPLPLAVSITSATEAKILTALGTALTVALQPDSEFEQTVFDICVSGYIKTTASGTIAIGVYADSGTTVTAGNLLHKTASATTQNTATAPFFIQGRLIYDSVSGKLTGKIGGMINNVIDPDIAISNVLTGISNTTVAGPVAFSLSVTSSGALTTAITTVNIQRFSVG